MIILKYLKKNILKTFIITFLILFSIFFAQQLIVAFTQVSRGNIPVAFVFKYILLNMPTMLQYFLPFAFFLGVLFTFIRMYNNQEMTVMYACGLSYGRVIKSLMLPTTIVFALCLVNSLYIAPSLQTESRNQIQYFRTNPTFSLISPGSFNSIPNTNYILFVNQIDGNLAKGIYVFEFNENNINFIMSSQGQVRVEDGQRLIVLENGSLFSRDLSDNFYNVVSQNLPAIAQGKVKQDNTTQELTAEQQEEIKKLLTPKSDEKGTLIFNSNDYTYDQLKQVLNSNLADINKINFTTLTLRIGLVQQESNLEAYKFKTVVQIISDPDIDKMAYLDLFVRIVNALSVYLFALLAFVFGKVNPRQGKYSNVIVSTSLYFVYLLILNSLSSVINKGKVIDTTLYVFIATNIIYVFLVFILISDRPYIKNNFIFARIRKFFGGQ
ncbi:hypothetical protein CJP74_04260 [Psittacicella melopsittaci]|uniref:Lipopolysaccharide export system permease protein LptF n=1 Tax=Psittacicella melopsittaci TaxID=2028576 RepID=A0A3A1Y905_9GAMM|nr:LptF/LptG family permease [Psittacicella melopsittaci]RIY32597.1 hypothetical protein CJP74_04260 [Psittacicella melopsittaci]